MRQMKKQIHLQIDESSYFWKKNANIIEENLIANDGSLV